MCWSFGQTAQQLLTKRFRALGLGASTSESLLSGFASSSFLVYGSGLHSEISLHSGCGPRPSSLFPYFLVVASYPAHPSPGCKASQPRPLHVGYANIVCFVGFCFHIEHLLLELRGVRAPHVVFQSRRYKVCQTLVFKIQVEARISLPPTFPCRVWGLPSRFCLQGICSKGFETAFCLDHFDQHGKELEVVLFSNVFISDLSAACKWCGHLKMGPELGEALALLDRLYGEGGEAEVSEVAGFGSVNGAKRVKRKRAVGGLEAVGGAGGGFRGERPTEAWSKPCCGSKRRPWLSACKPCKRRRSALCSGDALESTCRVPASKGLLCDILLTVGDIHIPAHQVPCFWQDTVQCSWAGCFRRA